ncbi:hypothetical protein [Dactylosporangium cerinum]
MARKLTSDTEAAGRTVLASRTSRSTWLCSDKLGGEASPQARGLCWR